MLQSLRVYRDLSNDYLTICLVGTTIQCIL